MTIAELIARVETWAPPSWQEAWDNCGWQVEPGVLDAPAYVLVCLTPTLAVMAEAIALQQSGIPVRLIFAHHPLIFTPLATIRQGDAVSDFIQLAMAHSIGVYSAHTNFDQVADGTADVLAQVLGLEATEPVVPTQPGVGYGRVGHLPQPTALPEVLAQIQAALTPPDLMVSPPLPGQPLIERLAVLGGSGASFINDVVKTGAQAYLTSDCKFHQFQEARDRGLILIDAGHYATERPACAQLTHKLQQLGAEWVQLSHHDEDFRQFNRPLLS